MGCIADTVTVIPLPKEQEAKEKNCSRCCEFPWLSRSCRLRSHEPFNNECGREQALTVSRVWMRHDNIDIDCEACETDGEHKGRDVVELDRGRVVVEGRSTQLAFEIFSEGGQRCFYLRKLRLGCSGPSLLFPLEQLAVRPARF